MDGFGVELLVGVASTVITLASALTVIWKVMLPHLQSVIQRELSDTDARVNEGVVKINKLSDIQDRDYERWKRSEACNAAMLTALLAILSHLREGNNTGAMKAAEAALTAQILEYSRTII